MGLRKRSWETKNGVTVRYEFSYILNGKQRKKTFKKKPSIEELAQITQTTVDNPYFKDAIDDYISNCSLHCKDSTIETYKNYKENAFKPLMFFRIKNMNKNIMSKFLVELKDKYSPKSYNNLLMFLKGFFNYFIDIKVIAENPIKKIKPLKLTKNQAKAMDEKLRNCFIGKASHYPFWVYVFFMTILEMGLRISECIALEWGDIDFENKKMYINKQYYRYRLTSTKNYETRTLDIPDDLLDLLKDLKIVSNLVFNAPTEIGKYASVNNLRETHFANIVQEMEDELNLDLSWLTPHCLRHTHATYLLSNGIPLKYVSERLGHRDTETTLNIYNHVLPSDNTKAINLLNQIKLKKSENRAKKNLIG